MNQRRSPEEIVQGLHTTADKIRALANAGYDRTEISKILGIRCRDRQCVGQPGALTIRLDVQLDPSFPIRGRRRGAFSRPYHGQSGNPTALPFAARL